MDALAAAVVFGFLVFFWAVKSEMKKLRGHIATVNESIDRLCRPTSEIAASLTELQTWLCGDKELRSRTQEASRTRKLDEAELIYLSPLLPQIAMRLDDIRRAVENSYDASGSLPPLGVATKADLEQAADAALVAVGSSTVSHISLLMRAARNNLRGKLFDDLELNTVVLTQMTRSKGTKSQ